MTMHISRRDAIHLSAAAGAMLLVSPSTGAAQDSEIELVFYGSASRTAHEDTALEEIRSRFEAEFPGIKIVHKFEGQTADSIQRMQSAQVSGEQLDLLKAGANNANAFLIPNKVLLDITDVATPLTDRFVEGSFDAVTIAERTWVVPVGGSAKEFTGWFYNNTLFDELGLVPPTTYQELLDVSEAIRSERDIEPSSYDFANQFTPGMWFFQTFAQTSGNQSIEFTREALSGRRQWNSPEEVAALNLIKRFFDDGIIAEGALDTNIDGVRALFQQQRIAMYYHGDWEWPWIRDNVTDFEPMVFEFPKVVDDPDVIAQHAGGVGNGIGLSSQLRDKPESLNAAAQYLEFLARPETAQLIADAVGPVGYPVIGVEVASNPVADYFNSVIGPNTIRFLDWMWPAELSQKIQANIQSTLAGGMSPEEAMQDVQSTFERMVGQGYVFEWWEEWSDEDWSEVTPAEPPVFEVI